MSSTRELVHPHELEKSSASSERDEPAAQGGDAAVVEALPRCHRLVVRDGPPSGDGGETGDRQIDEEDPAPAERLGEGPADEWPDGVAETSGGDHQSTGEAGTRLGQEVEGQAEDGRPHHGAADPHQSAEDDQRQRVGSEPGRQ